MYLVASSSLAWTSNRTSRSSRRTSTKRLNLWCDIFHQDVCKLSDFLLRFGAKVLCILSQYSKHILGIGTLFLLHFVLGYANFNFNAPFLNTTNTRAVRVI